MSEVSAPTVLGSRYELRELIGRGGMGVVYCAEDRLSGERVALKRVILPQHRAHGGESKTGSTEAVDASTANGIRSLLRRATGFVLLWRNGASALLRAEGRSERQAERQQAQ